ncbi:MAG TPA: PP2C family protein-serine/threonine phosphatase [Vicinamibacterales bacterium]|nr:PP2C family protein-serine/threonine phosphatase [Vicinamibacterales bacterium]
MSPIDETEEVSAQLRQLKQLTREIDNFRDIARYILPTPGETPRLGGVDIFGGVLPLSGSVGGDHLIYVDFKQRFDLDARIALAREERRYDVVENLEWCRRKAGIALVDVSGHRMTDALLAAMLHQAFLLGAIYELDTHGRITRRLFENLNTRFYQSSGAHKFVSLIYGEIAEDASFRFLSAAMPFPVVFSSRHDRFMEVGDDLRVSFPPLGMMPSFDVIDRSTTTSMLGFKNHYEMNKWLLMGQGDILLLYTDGIAEHMRGDEEYFPRRLESVIREAKRGTAREVFEAVKADLVAFSPPADDISLVVIKRS